jgi:hypothetical protein
MAGQEAAELARSLVFRERCRFHYADLRVMPTWRRECLVAA